MLTDSFTFSFRWFSDLLPGFDVYYAHTEHPAEHDRSSFALDHMFTFISEIIV